ncbi:MAG: type Z 30S ribosomal protein S14 [Chloroflexi bacterium]|nr:type Z 30S ribosomal protein S14 [Chloroflexota bacterium]
MAKKSMINRELHRKYKNRVRNRCAMCGRSRGYMRRFKLCRICFRGEAVQGHIPGVIKSSW